MLAVDAGSDTRGVRRAVGAIAFWNHLAGATSQPWQAFDGVRGSYRMDMSQPAMEVPGLSTVRALVELEAEHGVEHAAGTPRGQTPIKRGGALASIAFFEQLTC